MMKAKGRSCYQDPIVAPLSPQGSVVAIGLAPSKGEEGVYYSPNVRVFALEATPADNEG